MKFNHFALVFLIFCAFVSAPNAVFADTTCTVTINGVTQTGIRNLTDGTCMVTANQCQGKPINTSCTPTSGGTGKCDASGECVSVSTGTNTSNTTNTGVNTGTIVKLINPFGDGVTLNGFLVSILDLVVYLGSIVVILMLVYVGYLFVVAQGNESKLTEARKALLYTIVGALILLGSKAIAMGIQATVQAISTGN